MSAEVFGSRRKLTDVFEGGTRHGTLHSYNG